MTSENVAEQDAVESAAAVSAKAVDDRLIDELVGRAQAEGLQLTGEGGLLQQLTKRLLESALEGEITDHLGYDKHEAAGKNGGNSRNGKRSKTVLTDVGPVEIAVPRDRDGSFEPKIVKKRQKRLTGVDEMVFSLSAKGLTTGEVQAHLSEVYGADVSRQTISTITDKVLDGMAEWQNRPLDPVYPVVFIDAIHVKIRDGAVANRPIYVALAVTAEGRREILGLWAGDGGEGAKHWLHILTELKNRGVSDVLMLVCDGLKGLPEAVDAVWPKTIVQTCVVHLLRNSFRYAARQDWDKIAKLLKPVSPPQAGGTPTAPTEDAALERFAEFADAWGRKYPAIVKLWENAWVGVPPDGVWGRVHSVPAVRCRDPPHRLHHQRDRVGERADPAGGQGPRTLSQRAGYSEVLHGDHVPRPHRQGPGPLDHALEDRPESLRHHLRRPPVGGPSVTPTTRVTPNV
jgi:putative transposase